MQKFYKPLDMDWSENNKLRYLIQKLFLYLKILLVTLIYYPLTLTLISLFTPVYIFRFIVSKFSPIFRPDLGKLVHTRSTVLAVDGFPENPSWNIVVWLTQEGILDLDKLRQNFMTEHVQKRDENGHLVYPEYQQHLCKWWGFYFWRWDKSFDIQNHIRSYDGKFSNLETVDDKTLMQIVKELSWKSWDPNRSPWEFLQIKNYVGKNEAENKQPKPKSKSKEKLKQKSLMLLRIHHTLGDGYFVVKLLMGDLSGVNLETMPKPNYLKRNIFQMIFFWIGFSILGPYHLCKMYIEAYDLNPWHISREKFIRPFNASLTKPISLQLIKEIKNNHKVSFSSVIYSAIAGGIRNMMISQGLTCPKDIHMGIPVPMSGHPQKLRNHFICSFITLPVGTDDPLKRLMRAESIFQDWKHSSAAMLNFIKVPLIGALFPWMMDPFTTNRLSTCLLSNIPGTPDLPHFQGVRVTDMMFGVGLGPGNNGVGFTICSCKGQFRILSAADFNILKTDDDVAQLNAKIIKEFYILRGLGTT